MCAWKFLLFFFYHKFFFVVEYGLSLFFVLFRRCVVSPKLNQSLSILFDRVVSKVKTGGRKKKKISRWVGMKSQPGLSYRDDSRTRIITLKKNRQFPRVHEAIRVFYFFFSLLNFIIYRFIFFLLHLTLTFFFPQKFLKMHSKK